MIIKKMLCDICKREIGQDEKFCFVRIYKNCDDLEDVELIRAKYYSAAHYDYERCQDCCKVMEDALLKRENKWKS